MNEEDLRDCFAMFALLGIVSRIPLKDDVVSAFREEYGMAARGAYEYADAMLEARKADPEEEGIVALKKRKYERKTKE